MKTLLIGTHNRHKAEELSKLLSGLPCVVKTLSDFPDVREVEETGNTLEENAILKAKGYAEATGLLTLADDTGLEVRALNGEPGVYSARYAGEGCSYEDNNRKLMKALESKQERFALFRCVIACYDPSSKKLKIADGKLEGSIVSELRGNHGFGYDPVFYLPGFEKTLAELTLEEKNKISHRAQALLRAKELLQKELL